MSNKQYYSCERNHYFFGKLMTVRDFEAEQTYFNSKRRLGNHMLNGSGIVSGLDVILVDNRTISIETGMAIDYLGREIVLQEPNVRRLSVIDGFEENRENGDMYLCIAYKENFRESTFSVAGSSKDSDVSEEYNRITEGYDLFLTSKKPDTKMLGLKHLIADNVVLYDKDGIRLELEVSKYVNPSKLLKVSVIFEKNNVSAPVKYKFNIGGDFFKSIDGEDVTTVEYQETEVTTYKKVKKDYYLYCNASADSLADLIVDKKNFSISIGKNKGKIEEDIKQKVAITTKSVRDIVIDSYYAKHFDEIMEVREDQAIYLARFHVVSNQSTYFIEEFEKHPFKQYLLSNELLDVLQMLEENSRNDIKALPEPKNDNDANNSEQVRHIPDDRKVITGVERINLGSYPKVGKSYYSYEFVHGLGYGNVCVVAAVENKSDYLTNNDNVLVFGDGGVFSTEEFALSAPSALVGAMVNPDKGTMKLGVKLQEKTNVQAVDVRWWAFRANNDEPSERDIVIDDNVKVIISPNTTKVEPLKQVRFTAKIEGASSQEVRWSLADDGSGTIDSNGLYTAPAKEGVYEIKAQSVKFEDKVDYAYIVVGAPE